MRVTVPIDANEGNRYGTGRVLATTQLEAPNYAVIMQT